MSRPVRLLRNAVVILAALMVLATIAAVVMVQTDWFRETVRRNLIAQTEKATGGKVEIGSFAFDVSHLRATVTNFVIHGKEPSGAAPFVRADKVEVDLRLFTSLKHIIDISFLGIQHPAANVLIFPDGTTSLPTPRETSQSSESPLATVVDLAVGRFDLTNGAITLNDQKQELNIRGVNLRALLTWNLLKHSYQGQVSMEPLYVAAGRKTPVHFTVKLPIVVERDRIDIQDASITSARSSLQIDASVEKMNSPVTSAHIRGTVALEDLREAANLSLGPPAKNAPATVQLDANVRLGSSSMEVRDLHASLGKSSLEASGALQDATGKGALGFKANLSLVELGRITGASLRPEGDVALSGNAKLDSAYNFSVDGDIEARNLSMVENGQRIHNVNVTSALHVDPHLLRLQQMRLRALGGELTGNASLEDFQRYRVDGNLRNIDVREVLHEFAPGQRLPYDGVASGAVNVSGDTKTSGAKSLVASVRLNIAPGRAGIPISGRMNVDYRGANDRIAVQNSYLALPHSKLTLNGSAGQRLDVVLTSTDLNDFLAATAMAGPHAPVRLDHGQASFTGTVNGNLRRPEVAGHLAVDNFSVEGRAFSSLQADVAASPAQASVRNGILTRAGMSANFAAQLGLHDWSPTPKDQVTADVALRNGDMADLMALAGESPAGYAGAVTADAHIQDTTGNPQGTVSVTAANGTLDGERFDRLEARANLSDQRVTIPSAFITAGGSRIDASGEFQHPRDSFTTGHIQAHARSNPIHLEEISALQKQEPNTGGTAQINVDLTGDLGGTFVVTSINGDASIKGLRMQGRSYGDLTANASTRGQTVTYSATSDFTGSTIRLNGSTQLAADYPTNADATIRNLQIAPALALAQQSGIPATGRLSGSAHFHGTLKNPEGSADVDLTNAVVYGEPLDRVHASASYLPDAVDVPQFEVTVGPSHVAFTAHYDHASSNIESGKLRFRVSPSQIDLARIKNIQKLRPGLAGRVEMSGDGEATLGNGNSRILLTSLNAKVSGNGLSVQGKSAGSFTLAANTTAADRLNFTLNSDLAGSSIGANGNAQLGGNYPVTAQVSFQNVTWSKLQPLVAPSPNGQPMVEAVVDGQANINGPVMNVAQLNASLTLSRLNVTSIPQPGSGAKPIAIQNDGPIQVAMANGAVRLLNVKLNGPKTTIQAIGNASLQGGGLNVVVNANADLGLLKNFSREIDSSAGSVVVATTIRGTVSDPLINGSLELHNAGLHYSGSANGISKANGTIAFNGSTATIRSLTAESGGGTIKATGFVGYATKLRFGLHASASRARILIEEGVSVVTNADLQLTGTSDRSLVSGTVTIETLSYRPQSDLGSLLSRAAPPVQAPSAPFPLFDNMRLDVRVRTSPALAVQASLAENLQADADLRVRGTVSQPGVLGRVTISEGQLVFFGSTYTVNSGTIAFYNPIRIDPTLDVSLETKAKGVDVVLHVTGPIDNMKLSYTSDPPLQFQEILSLLAAGQTPTSDPTLLANQPAEPPQTFEQMGESALVGKALADPVSNRLQRVFGVTQLKIDPAFTNGSQVPQARLTLQQQVSSNITFTYISDLNDPNATIIRVEWAFNQRWSAVAMRDQNGIVSVNLFYKKQFR